MNGSNWDRGDWGSSWGDTWSTSDDGWVGIKVRCADTLEVSLSRGDIIISSTVGGKTFEYVANIFRRCAITSCISVGAASSAEHPGVQALRKDLWGRSSWGWSTWGRWCGLNFSWA